MPRITVTLSEDEYGQLTGLAAEQRRPVPWQAAKLIADGLARTARDDEERAMFRQIAAQPIVPPPPRPASARDPGPASAKEIGRQHARLNPLVIEDEAGLPPPSVRGTAPNATTDPRAAELFRITEETLAETTGR